MDVREKLVELLRKVQYQGNAVHGYQYKYIQNSELAAHLIAHGVTVQEWIPVTERLPESLVPVLCWYEYFRYGNYNCMYQTFGLGYYFRDGMWGGEVSNGHQTKVLAWMPLPQPPKGE